MLRGLDSDGTAFLAWEADKKNRPYFCPFCRGELILHQGRIKAHHFAHKPPVACIYGAGESDIHHRIKRQLYTYLKLQPNCEKCEVERNLETVRPDISLYIDGVPVAIEIQKSTLDIQILRQRMTEYTKKKIAVLWILPEQYPTVEYHKNGDVYVHRALEWETCLHELNCGKLYYWQGDNTVKAYHFEPFLIYRNITQWYGEDGSLQASGGYHYPAKKLKVCTTDERCLHIEKDFIKKVRGKKPHNTLEIPECLLYRDTCADWWHT